MRFRPVHSLPLQSYTFASTPNALPSHPLLFGPFPGCCRLTEASRQSAKALRSITIRSLAVPSLLGPSHAFLGCCRPAFEANRQIAKAMPSSSVLSRPFRCAPVPDCCRLTRLKANRQTPRQSHTLRFNPFRSRTSPSIPFPSLNTAHQFRYAEFQG